jgi:hypothetical protein
VGDHDVQSLNVRTGVRTTMASFGGYSNFLIGPWEGNLSADGSSVVIFATSPAGASVVFDYDMLSATKYPDIPVDANNLDWASISPKADYIVIYHNDMTTQVCDLNGNVLSTWTESGVPDHYDLAVDVDGSEVAVGSARSGTYDGRIVKRRLKDGVITALTPGGYGEHSSTRNLRRPGWVYVSMFEDATSNDPPYSAEIDAVKMDGSMTVERLAQFRSTECAYDNEAMPSPSPDGSKVIFGSDWMNCGGPIQAYVIDLPGVAAGTCR